jgi:hypothetical protein
MPRVAFADEARRIAANIAKLPELCCAAVRYQKLPAAFSGRARGILRRVADLTGDAAGVC